MEIACQRDGPAFPWHYGLPGTLTSVLWVIADCPLRYSLADPLATVPGDDLLPKRVLAQVLFDPASFAGGAAATTFDARHKKWLILTYAGSNTLYVVPQAHQDDIDAWLTQPAVAGPPAAPSPYGTAAKQYAILGAVLPTHVVDFQSV